MDTWTARDGTQVLIKDMTDDHLINAIRWCRRNEDRIEDETADAYSFAGSTRGEMASYYADQYADMAADRMHYFFEAKRSLEAEAKRRGLKP